MNYKVRVSRRARRVILRLDEGGGLEVTIPSGFDPAGIAAVVAAHQSWIEERRKRLASRPPEPAEPFPPAVIPLRALEKEVAVRFGPERHGPPRLTYSPAFRLDLSGDWSRIEDGRYLLRCWLLRMGRFHLGPWLDRLSLETGLAYRRFGVRDQKTRWGSCSNRGAISLNGKLLFFPPRYARYVMLHELCHTVHLNHSDRFWSLLARFESDCRSLDRELRRTREYIPHWANGRPMRPGEEQSDMI